MYAVQYVSDEELPMTDWAFAREGRRMYLFIRESIVCPETLSEAWAAFVEIQAGRVPVQQRRQLALPPAATR